MTNQTNLMQALRTLNSRLTHLENALSQLGQVVMQHGKLLRAVDRALYAQSKEINLYEHLGLTEKELKTPGSINPPKPPFPPEATLGDDLATMDKILKEKPSE